jgi:hypothetical protein
VYGLDGPGAAMADDQMKTAWLTQYQRKTA